MLECVFEIARFVRVACIIILHFGADIQLAVAVQYAANRKLTSALALSGVMLFPELGGDAGQESMLQLERQTSRLAPSVRTVSFLSVHSEGRAGMCAGAFVRCRVQWMDALASEWMDVWASELIDAWDARGCGRACRHSRADLLNGYCGGRGAAPVPSLSETLPNLSALPPAVLRARWMLLQVLFASRGCKLASSCVFARLSPFAARTLHLDA